MAGIGTCGVLATVLLAAVSCQTSPSRGARLLPPAGAARAPRSNSSAVPASAQAPKASGDAQTGGGNLAPDATGTTATTTAANTTAGAAAIPASTTAASTAAKAAANAATNSSANSATGSRANEAAQSAPNGAGVATPAPAQNDVKSAAPAGPAPKLEGADSARKNAFDVDGSLALRWRGRESGDAHDQDAYAVLSLAVGDAEHDRVSGRFLGRLTADVDGRGDADSQAVFGSLQDTHGDSLHVDLYEVSADVRRPFDVPARLRLGRQIDYATPEFAHFDGLRLESEPLGKAKLVAGAYAGVPVRLYEATSIDDQMFGAWTEARPWKDGRVRADWMRVSQEAEPSDFDDDLLGLSVWQRLGPKLGVEGSWSRLENENRDVRLRANWNDGDAGFSVVAVWYQLLNPLRAFASEFDPFFATLQQYEPYRQARLNVSKTLGEHVRVDAGGDVRRLEDGDDEGRLNHDYERGYATVVWSDGLARGLDLSLTGDAWNSDTQDARTWGLDLTWNPNASWRASVGSSYSLYKYDVISDVERDDVRTWYARVRKKLSEAWSVNMAYEFDDDDFDDYSQLTLGATWHF